MIRHRILLNDRTPLASGNNRDVFIHPDDADLLIKTIKPEAVEKRASGNASWTKHLFRRFKHYLGFLRECQEHIVSRLGDEPIPDFVHTVVGFVDTDRGLGLVTRAERDHTGAYARTLAQLIEKGIFDEDAKAAFEKFKQSFLSSRVIVTDTNLRNLMYSHDPEIGYHFVLIDGYGEKNLIPFNSTFQWCNLRSKRKRIARLERAVVRYINNQPK